MAHRPNAWYGWQPDKPDHRDLVFRRPPAAVTQPLPDTVDLRPDCPPVYDQAALGSCIANAIAAALEFDQRKQAEPESTPSRLFIYYCVRVIEGTVKEDAGGAIRDGIKAVNSLGAPPETKWPYVIDRFARKPSVAVYRDAKKRKTVRYSRVDNSRLDNLRAALAGGLPVVFGFSVYSAFESDAVAQSGILDLPAPGEKLVGGHAVLAVGYDMATQRLLVRNSWGPDWGQAGYFTMPLAYATNPNLADDFWRIEQIQ